MNPENEQEVFTLASQGKAALNSLESEIDYDGKLTEIIRHSFETIERRSDPAQ